MLVLLPVESDQRCERRRTSSSQDLETFGQSFLIVLLEYSTLAVVEIALASAVASKDSPCGSDDSVYELYKSFSPFTNRAVPL